MAYGVATNNPFDLLGDDDEQISNAPAPAPAAEPAKKADASPKKSTQPAKEKAAAAKPAASEEQAPAANKNVREGKGGGKGGKGRGYPRNDDTLDGDVAPYQGRGGKGGKGKGKGKGKGEVGFYAANGGGGGGGGDGEERRPPRREYDRRSGPGKGQGQVKRDGSGRGNWGSNSDDITQEKPADLEVTENGEGEKPAVEDGEKADGEAPETPKEEEPDNEMTLEEYQKVQDEKKKDMMSKYRKEPAADRQAEDLNGLAKVEKVDVENENAFALLEVSGKKSGKDKSLKTKEVVETNFSLAPTNDGYVPRKGKGDGKGDGRKGGKGFGGRGRGGKGSRDARDAPSSPMITDNDAFPTLSSAKK